MENEVQEIDVPEMLKQIYNHDFTESWYVLDKAVLLMPQEDKNFLQILGEGIRLEGGHYEISLPLRNENVSFPNNRIHAEKRFAYL